MAKLFIQKHLYSYAQDMDILFESFYSIFDRNGLELLYFQLLEPFIVGKKLDRIPTDILKRMVEVYAKVYPFTHLFWASVLTLTVQHSLYSSLESMLLSLSVDALDFHQVVHVCQKYRLSAALFYLYGTGLDEYVHI